MSAAEAIRDEISKRLFEDHHVFLETFEAAIKKRNIKLGVTEKTAIIQAVSWRAESAAPVIKKVHKPGKAAANPRIGLFEVVIDSKRQIVEYEPDSELRDYEQIPLLEPGGIEAFFEREVLPYLPDAWIDDSATRVGYEISFTRYFYNPQKLRKLHEIIADIIALEKETKGLLQQIIGSYRQ